MRRRSAVLAAVWLLIFPTLARADGVRVDPDRWWQAWNRDPLVLLSLFTLAWFYSRGWTALSRGGAAKKIRSWQAACFFGGLGVLLLALLSPLDAVSGELASAHMVQHMLLTSVAAPLFVAGSPGFVLAWGLRSANEGWTGRVYTRVFRLWQNPLLWRPLLVGAVYGITLWAWHHPVMYHAALRDEVVHDAQHVSFFVTACLFWRVCLDPLGARRLTGPGAVLYLFATWLHNSVLGIFLTLSPRVWYGDYAARTDAWGLSPLMDQQLAGLIMWMPACLVYPAVAALLFGTWLAGMPQQPGHRGQTIAFAQRNKDQSWLPRSSPISN